MANQLESKTKEQIAGDLLRTILINSDLTDVAQGSTTATLIEAIASVEFQIQMSILKILEASNIESLTGVNLDKKATSIGVPNGIGGQGRSPASQASGPIVIGSSFVKVSSKPYAGKPAPFAGSRRLYLEKADLFSLTGSIYIGRGTPDRFEGPIPYTSLTDNGSFWVMELSSPLTKSHPYTDLVVLSQGGDRTIQAGATVLVPANSNSPAVQYTTNTTLVIPDGEAEGTVQVTCTNFGAAGNALAGAIKEFSSLPFPGATVRNATSFQNGRATESDEELRRRIKNYPSTLSRGTRGAILAALQGARDPETGRAITSVAIVEPVEPGDPSKAYIDDGTGLEPSFRSQPYELLLKNASGQETKFRVAQVPVTSAVAIGSENGPFILENGQELSITLDGITESYEVTGSNYRNLNSASAYEVVRDFNSQSNIIGFRTINGGNGIAAFDLSGQGEIMQVETSDLQKIFGFSTAELRPIFLYKNSQIQSFRGHTATLTTSSYPWTLNVGAGDLSNNRVVVDGVVQTFSVSDSDFSEFGTIVSSATLQQWATILSRKLSGVKFTVLGNRLVWSTWQSFSPSGSLEILTTKANGAQATWIGAGKMWESAETGGVLADVGSTEDFKFNRFTGDIEFLSKPDPNDTIEIGSRSTRAQLSSILTTSGLYALSPITPGPGNARIVVGFDGEFAIRSVAVGSTTAFTPSFPDPVGAYNVVRLFSNEKGLFESARIGDYLYLVKDDSIVPTWGSKIEGLYLIKSVGVNGFPTNQVYANITASVENGSNVVTVSQASHGFKTGASITVADAGLIGGISLAVTDRVITVVDANTYTYLALSNALSDDTGTLDSVTYNADTWIEFEVSSDQRPDWALIDTIPQNMKVGMVNIFKSTVVPQIVDFGAVGSVTVDGVVSTINDQIAGGVAVKLDAQSFIVRSSDYEAGTVAVFAAIGNAESMIDVGISESIQAHVAYSKSGYTHAGFPVATLSNQTSQASGYATRAYLKVEKDLTNITDTNTDPTIQSSSGVASYPIGFEELWLTGRYTSFTGRVYNNTTTVPFTGLLRGTKAIRPPQTADTRQTSVVGVLDRYAHFGLRLRDIALTEHDRLVVEMDLNPTDKTVVVPVAKIAKIQDIDALTGAGKGQVIAFRLKDPEDLDGFSQPRPFFDSQSIYKDFDFSDFKLLTKSVGVYIDSAGSDLPARGSLTAIPAKVGQFIEDGDTFTLDDGTQAATTFEFDDGGGVAPGNVAIVFTPGVAATGTLTAISAIPGVSIEDGDTFTLDDGVNPATTFEFDGNSSYILGNTPVVFIPGVKATGQLTAIAAGVGTGIEDGDTFTLDDGVNPATTFEFDTNASVTLGNVAVTIGASDTATLVKAAMIAAINGVGAALLITATPGPGNDILLENDNYGTAGNVAISESISNAQTLSPLGMSGGVDNPTASDIKTAMLSAINGVGAGLLVTASSGAGDDIDLVNDDTGSQGNVAIIENISNSATLTPVGMSGGIDDPSASVIKSLMIAAINGVGATLKIGAFSGAGDLIDLTNETPAVGNIPITESISNGQTLTPVGMSGAVAMGTDDKAIVLRSVAFGSPSLLRLSIRYATLPDQGDIIVDHLNDYSGSQARTTLLVSLPSAATVAGSTYDSGNYTVYSFAYGNLMRLRFEAAGLNPGSQYIAGNVLNVGGTGDLAGSYKIIYATAGAVEVIAPGISGYASPSVFAADENPLISFPLVSKTLTDVATAINDYNPENPIATAEAIGTSLPAWFVTNPTYMTYEASTLPSIATMAAAFSHHSFSCKYSGSAGIWQYDSSNPLLNNIKATVQSDDSIFPTVSDAGATTYTPVNEEVYLVPSNTKTLERWMNFSAVSSLPVLANIEAVQSCDSLQISSKLDGGLGAVLVSGVTANRLDSFVIGNATNEDNSTRLRLLFSEAKTLVRDQLVKVENSVSSEIRRAYRTTPAGDSITPANSENTGNYFRDTSSIKYIRLGTNSARIIFLRNGKGSGQVEPLNAGESVTLANLGSGLVRVTCTVAAGILSARVGDMMYVRPYGSSPFPADVQCPDLDVDGATEADNPEYWGYPVVHVTDERDITILAPNITSFGVSVLNEPEDLVFVPAVWNEKNIRTNRAEGSKFATLVNSGNAYVVVKKLGGNMLSIWLQNSSTELTDDMKLDQMSVSTDDWVILGEGFDQDNQGTFKLVAHNGRNHLIVFHPQGGKDEVFDTTTMVSGGIGSRKWAVGPITVARPIRILDAESVRIGDRFRISTPLTNNQYFPSTMIGTWEITGIGYIGRDYTGDPLPHGPSDGVKDGRYFTQYVDIFLPNAPEFVPDGSNNPVDSFVLTGNVSSVGFVEKDPFFGFRQVSGTSVNTQNSEESDVFLTPKLRTDKMTDLFGAKVSAAYKTAFEERTFIGIDGYKTYDGLIREAHRIADGSPVNSVVYPGVRAAGVRIEVLPPLIKAISVSLQVRPRDGVTLNAISDVIKSAVAGYINGLGVGRPVVISEIVKIVQSLSGVFSVTVTETLPVVVDDRITVSDIEKAFVLDAQRDISVG